MKNVEDFLTDISTMGIAGHLRPDGDAVGSTMALYLYVKKYHPEIQADIYLDHPQPVFGHIPHFDEVKMQEEEPSAPYDLFVTLDASSRDRLSVGAKGFETARRTICIDHHISNTGFADVNHVCGDISSCSEVLYSLIERDKIDYDIAILGCGAYGFNLAAHVKRSGKKAIHLGGVTQLLFGIRGSRWETPNQRWYQNGNYPDLMNEYWCRPNEREQTVALKKVENACYL